MKTNAPVEFKQLADELLPPHWSLLWRNSLLTKAVESTGRCFRSVRVIVVTEGTHYDGQLHALLHEISHARTTSLHNAGWETELVRLCKRYGLGAEYVAEREEIYGYPLHNWVLDTN